MSQDFRGIAVLPGQPCCGAAQALGGKRLLMSKAPRLPLDECDRAGTCRCRYRKFPDRRDDSGDRRVLGVNSASIWTAETLDRRKTRGRRKTDPG
jgi:hypothetical protein